MVYIEQEVKKKDILQKVDSFFLSLLGNIPGKISGNASFSCRLLCLSAVVNIWWNVGLGCLIVSMGY
jgi:hypothetical protein